MGIIQNFNRQTIFNILKWSIYFQKELPTRMTAFFSRPMFDI